MIDLLLLWQATVFGLAMGSLYALLSLGLSMIFGVMKLVNAAHGSMYMVGAYAAFVVSSSAFSPIVALGVSMALVCSIGIVVESTIIEPIKRNETAVTILTLGLAIAFEQAFQMIFGPTYRGIAPLFPGLTYIAPSVTIETQRLGSAGVAIAFTAILGMFLIKTKLGKAFRLVAADSEMASLLGVDVKRITMMAFGLGVALAAGAGTLLAPLFLIYPAMGWAPLVISFCVVILGGLGSMKGTVFAGFIYGVVEAFTAYYIAPQWKTIDVYLIIIVILLIRPQGLFGKEIKKV
jgi:branched-chain amino acid transport system permease protein